MICIDSESVRIFFASFKLKQPNCCRDQTEQNLIVLIETGRNVPFQQRRRRGSSRILHPRSRQSGSHHGGSPERTRRRRRLRHRLFLRLFVSRFRTHHKNRFLYHYSIAAAESTRTPTALCTRSIMASLPSVTERWPASITGSSAILGAPAGALPDTSSSAEVSTCATLKCTRRRSSLLDQCNRVFYHMI